MAGESSDPVAVVGSFLRRRWLTLVGVLAVAAIALVIRIAFSVSAAEATAVVRLGRQSPAPAPQGLDAEAMTAQWTLATGQLERSPGLSVVADPEQSELRFSVRAASRERAVRSADASAAEYVRRLDELSSPPAVVVERRRAVVTDVERPALAPTLAGGAAVGLLAALLAAMVRDRMDKRLRNRDDVRRAVGRPVLGSVPFAPGGGSPGAGVDLSQTELRSGWQRTMGASPGLGADRAKSVLIAAGHTAGESAEVAQLLALAAADAGERTMLVELGGAYGSTQVLEPSMPSPLTARSEVVVFHARDLLAAAHCLPAVDAVVLVADVRRTDADQLRREVALIERQGADVRGVVLTNTAARRGAPWSVVLDAGGRLLGRGRTAGPSVPAASAPAIAASAEPAAVAATVRPSRFRENFLKVAKANLVARGLPMLASPLLTRLFAPEYFAAAALFTSLLGVLEAFAVWRVDWSLPNVDKDTGAALTLVGLAALASTVVLCAAVLLGFRDELHSYEGMRNLGDAALLLPVALFALGAKSLLSGWHIRNNDLGAISGATIVESVVIVLIGVGAGAIGMLTFGQPAARTLSIAAATGVVLYSSRDLIDACRAVSRAQLVYTWRQFRSETTWSTMVALVNTASYSLPLLLLSAYYTGDQVGAYALMLSAAFAPITVFSTALAQSFWGQAAELFRAGRVPELRLLYLRTTRHLALVAVPVVIGCLAGPLYVGYIFGAAKWSDAGKVLAMMTPMIVGALLFSATNHLVVFSEQRAQFPADVMRTVASVGGLALVHALDGGFLIAVLVSSLASMSGHFALFALHLRVYRNHGRSSPVLELADLERRTVRG